MRNHNNLFEILYDLFLAVKPRNIAYSKNSGLQQGESFSMSCTALRYPAPSVGWRTPENTSIFVSSITTLGTNTTATHQMRNVRIKTLNLLSKTFFISCFNFLFN